MRFLRPFKFFFVFAAFCSCSSYSELIVEYRVPPPKNSGYYYKESDEGKDAGFKKVTGKSFLVSSSKYFVRGKGSEPELKIMEVAVDEALRGNYIEAEILFKELTVFINDGSPENNLGVIYEKEKRSKEAMNMYINALVKSPENIRFRSNLLSFICHNNHN